MTKAQATSKPHNASKPTKRTVTPKTEGKGVKRAVVKLGRPVGDEYTEAIAVELCSRIAEGVSLRRVCLAEDMPHIRTVYKWFQSHPDFIQHYARAKEDSADSHADDILELADKVVKGEIPAKAGHVAIQAKMWSASKLKPRRYGERLDVTSGGEAIQPPNIYLPGELPYNAVLQADSTVVEHKAIEQGKTPAK
jgi:hypothetical protein